MGTLTEGGRESCRKVVPSWLTINKLPLSFVVKQSMNIKRVKSCLSVVKHFICCLLWQTHVDVFELSVTDMLMSTVQWKDNQH